MLIPLIIFIFYNVKIVFKKWEIKRVVVVVVVVVVIVACRDPPHTSRFFVRDKK